MCVALCDLSTTHLDDGCNELLEEARNVQELRPEFVQKVDDKPLRWQSGMSKKKKIRKKTKTKTKTTKGEYNKYPPTLICEPS